MGAGLSGMDMLRFMGSMLLVLALLGGLLWGLKRLQAGALRPGGLKQLHVVEAVSVGPRQKIALVRVGQREVLVGISPAHIAALGQWPAAAGATDSTATTVIASASAPDFAAALKADHVR